MEQLSILLRWVEDDYTIYEDLLGLHQGDETDAESILVILEFVFLSHGLDVQSIRAQTHGRAAVL